MFEFLAARQHMAAVAYLEIGDKDLAVRRMVEAEAIYEANESPHAATARALLEEWRGGNG